MNKIIFLIPMFFCYVNASFGQPGKLDSSFGDNGIAKIDLGSSYDYPYEGRQVLSESDGSMYFITERPEYSIKNYYYYSTVIEKKFKDGSTDVTYGYKGYSTPLSISNPIAALQADGKIVVVGTSNDQTFQVIRLARFNTNGSLDKSFGYKGIMGIGMSSYRYSATCIAIELDGKIIIGGGRRNYDYESGGTLLSRFNRDGSLDTMITGDFYGDDYSSQIRAVAIQTDGKIVVARAEAGLRRYNPDLSTDSTFSIDPLPEVDPYQGLLNIQNNGKILVAGNSDVGRYNIDGSIDSTFNGRGSIYVGFTISSMGIQGNGKIIVAGSVESIGNGNFAVARYNTNGSLDSTFDADGKKFTDFGSGNDYANSVVIQPDGKILALGSTTKGNVIQIAAVRFKVNGTPDNSFDKDGKLTEQLNQGNTSYTGMAVQDDGKIITVGNTWNGSNWDFAIVRYKTDGILDSTFSGDGKQTTHFGGTNSHASSVALQNDGKIVVGGSSEENFALCRYNTDGRLDSTFDGDGSKIADFGSTDYINKVIILSTGKILVGGSRLARFYDNGPLDTSFHPRVQRSDDIAIQKDGKIIVVNAADLILFSRYNADGTVDKTFGKNGSSEIEWSQDSYFATFSIVIQNDGKILFGGTHYTFTEIDEDYSWSGFLTGRINSNGSIDTTFGGGVIQTELYTQNARSIQIQKDDKIILAGASSYINSDFKILRLYNDGSIDETFNIWTTPICSGEDRIAAIDLVGNKLYAAGFGEFPGSFGVLARFLLSEDDAPTVSITSPAQHEIFVAAGTGANVPLRATANNLNLIIKSVQFYIGATLLSTDSTSPYTYTIDNLAPGNYSLVAKAIDINGLSTTSATVAISVLESVNRAPSVYISDPVTNSTFIAPAAITVNATASDPDGTITLVRLFSGSTLLGTDSTAPYSYTVNNLPAGTYKIYAQATDNKGLKNASSIKFAFVVPGASNLAPAVSITEPGNNTNYPAPTTLVLQASAHDTDGTITSVRFYKGAVLLNTDTTPPYSCLISNLTSGNYFFVAKAMDNKGSVSNSASVHVSVGPSLNKSPVINITAPVNNTSFIAGSNITLSATARDPDDKISKVEFFNGSTLLGTNETRPFSIVMYDVVPGNYEIYARAADSKGLATVSSTVSLFVVPDLLNKAPRVDLVNPWNNAFHFTPGTIPLSAYAYDDDGIANVKFYHGSTLIATDSIAPYNYKFTNLPVGKYVFTARATDKNGLQGKSADAVVFMLTQPPKAPVINFTSPVNNSTYIAPASIILNATATDEDGTITSVKFFDGAKLLQTVRKSPYIFTMNNVPAGPHKFFAKATDNSRLTNATSPYYVMVIAESDSVKGSGTMSKSSKVSVRQTSKSNSIDPAPITLSPNPVRNILTINTSGLQNNKQTISIMSISGVVMKTFQTTPSAQTIRLNVSSLASGVYIVKIKNGDTVKFKRFVKL